MTDLINKVDSLSTQELEAYKNGYSGVMEFIKPISKLPYVVYSLNIAINYINEHEKTLDVEMKCWLTVLIKELCLRDKILFVETIIVAINDFISFHKNNFQNYLNERDLKETYWDIERCFLYEYIDNNFK